MFKDPDTHTCEVYDYLPNRSQTRQSVEKQTVQKPSATDERQDKGLRLQESCSESLCLMFRKVMIFIRDEE